MARLRLPLVILLLAAALAPGAGCRGKRSFATEGDALRRQVVDLEDENRALKRQVQELRTELERAAGEPQSLPVEVREAVPHVVSIAVGRLSHLADSDDDGTPDLLRVYVRPEDGLGRFVQLVGTLSVNAAVLPAGAEARTVGLVTLAPGELRRAYRSGVTGTHYTVECPLRWPEGRAEQVIVNVHFADALTGRTLRAERAVGP